MKKIIIVLLTLALFACGGDIHAQQTQPQVGGSSGNYVPLHGHSGTSDGGMIFLPSFSAYHAGGTQVVTSGAWTKVTAETVEFDTKGWYNNTTYRFTPQLSGNYLVTINNDGSCVTSMTGFASAIFKNGSVYKNNGQSHAWAGNNLAVGTLTAIISMNGSTDYLESYVQLVGTGTCNVGFNVGSGFAAILVSY